MDATEGTQPQLLQTLTNDGVVEPQPMLTLPGVLDYLTHYGHLPFDWRNWQDMSVDDVVEAIKSFQSFFNLVPDGQAGPKTMRAMLTTSRCGCPDIVRPHHTEFMRLQEAAAAKLAEWTKRSLTYFINGYVSGIAPDVQKGIVAQAFKSWTDLANIQIQPLSSAGGQPDLVVDVGKGATQQFDGPGGVLAWAYMPDGNDQQLYMRFDLAETWINDPAQRGILMLNVAAHEFGHLLGLSHSKVNTALMAPYYNPGIASPQANDDIPRVQARYGAALGSAGSTPPPSGTSTVTILGAIQSITVPTIPAGTSVPRASLVVTGRVDSVSKSP